MKRAVILHSKESHGHAHWYPWLKGELETRGYEVWTPDLPDPVKPSGARWTEALLSNADWDFNENLVIGHSAGAVEVLQLAQALPEGVRLRAGVLCSSFNEMLTKEADWRSELKDLFVPVLDYAKIKQHCAQFFFVHAKDDPWCPLEQAEYLAEQTAGELKVLSTGRHFSTSLDPEFTQFPQLLQLLDERNLV